MIDASRIVYAAANPALWLSQFGLASLALDDLARRQWVTAIKTAGEQVASSTTLQDDDHLLLNLQASTSYMILHHAFVAEAGTSDMKNAFAYSGTAASALLTQLIFTFSTSSWAGVSMALDSEQAITLDQSDVILTIGTVTTTTAGVLQWQWAQNSSEADAITVSAGSFLAALPIV